MTQLKFKRIQALVLFVLNRQNIYVLSVLSNIAVYNVINNIIQTVQKNFTKKMLSNTKKIKNQVKKI